MGSEEIQMLIEEGGEYAANEQFDKANEAFTHALDLDPTHTYTLYGKAFCLRKLGNYENAQVILNDALSLYPYDTELLNERGMLHYDQKQYDQAIEAFDQVLALDPENEYARNLKVKVLTKINRSREALEFLQKLKEAFVNDLGVASELGWFYIQRNELMSAQKEFQFILEKDSNNTTGTTGLGAVYFNQGDYEAAEDNFRQVMDAEPNEPVFHTNLAWALVRQDKEGEFAEAEKHCRRALQLDPNYAQAFGCLGVLAFKRGNLRESEDYLRTSIEVNPEEGNYSDLGALYIQMERYEEAEEKLKKAIEINKDDVQAHVELGNFYLKTYKPKKAVREFRQAMAIDPYNEAPRRAIAVALMRTGELVEAERVLREAIRLLDKSKRWQLHLTLCRVLTRIGDDTGDSQFYEEALEEVVEAIHLKPDHPDPYFHGGIVRSKLEDYRGALKNFRSCLKQDPHRFEAERNAMRIQLLLRKERVQSKGSLSGGIGVGVISIVQLIVLWIFYLGGKVTETMLTILVPVLLGLVVVAFLLPWLIRIKLPGLEAELSQPTETVSSGPTGEVGFGSSPPTISSGPR